jgi:hypothetical protein
MLVAMDVAKLREKAALCLRIARGLSWNNPGRLQLTELAERFDRQAKESDELRNLPSEERLSGIRNGRSSPA